MTAKKAIEFLRMHFEYLKERWKPHPDYNVLEAIRFAISAIEKQIPKEPIMKQYFENLEEEYLCCPTCGEILTDRIPADNKTFYFHCMNCGQKFDWRDEE